MPALSSGDRLRFFSGQWVKVSSSNVREARYQQLQQVLEIEFHSGGLYTYYNVPLQMAASFASAPSQGKWVHARLVRANWPFTKYSTF